ncbi:hypothetical protein [Streptomyces sp. NPDC001594]|uniref:hypothetical protein n=1 Tax=Streptomyces sp. NPDC001594 TaxID=3364590 RepID=UPI0036CD7D69
MTTTMSNRSARFPIDESRARFRDLIAIEWIKLWSRPCALLPGPSPPSRSPSSSSTRTTSFAGMSVVLVIGAIGTLTVTGGYSTGKIRTTFTAVPARR